MVLVTQKKRRPTIHEKRRVGQHHKHTPDYHKAYWPYLPMALIVGLGIVVNVFWGNIQHRVLDYATGVSVSGLLQDTNQQRLDGGLGTLTLNAKLDQAAQAKANDMVARDYWSHDTPDGTPPWQFITNAGYDYSTSGENLAYGFATSADTVTGWMNSPGHRANIMNTTYTDVGFGFANSPNYQGTGPETVIVAMYASPEVVTAAASMPKTTASASSAPAVTATPEQAAPAPQNPAPVAATTTQNNAAPAAAPATRSIARIQLLSGNAAPAWSTFAITAIATVCIAVLLLRHALLFRRVLVRSEAFVHKHPVLDIALVAIATAGFVLTRASGIIG